VQNKKTPSTTISGSLLTLLFGAMLICVVDSQCHLVAFMFLLFARLRRAAPLSDLTVVPGTVTTTLTIKQSEIMRRLFSRNAKALDDAEEAMVDEDCPVCKHPKLSYRTAQLRGLDEGQTVFYTCLNADCRHKFTVNS
jgi:DNA-directed RNA polymerase subunit M/transcription elongation factor TFIIS